MYLFLVKVPTAQVLLTSPCPPALDTASSDTLSFLDSPHSPLCPHPLSSTLQVSSSFPPLLLAANFLKEESHANTASTALPPTIPYDVGSRPSQLPAPSFSQAFHTWHCLLLPETPFSPGFQGPKTSWMACCPLKVHTTSFAGSKVFPDPLACLLPIPQHPPPPQGRGGGRRAPTWRVRPCALTGDLFAAQNTAIYICSDQFLLIP